jgi:radical SAM protein with 4Fe4S-binding SPASM domain
LPTNSKFKRKVSSVYKTLCRTPLWQAVVYWNGDLGLCCIDYDNDFKLPNVKSGGFLKNYNSDKAVKFRKIGFRKQAALCRKCSLGDADSMGFNINFQK